MPTNRKKPVDDDTMREDPERDVETDDEQGTPRRTPQQASETQNTGTSRGAGNQGRGSSNKKRK